MNWIMNRVIKRMGAKKLAALAWKWGKPKLEKYVASTENDMDNDALEIISAIVEGFLE